MEPVFLSDGPDRQFHYARAYTRNLLNLKFDGLPDEPVRPALRDILLGLDLYWFVSDIEATYRRWHAMGVSIQFVVYDIPAGTSARKFPA